MRSVQRKSRFLNVWHNWAKKIWKIFHSWPIQVWKVNGKKYTFIEVNPMSIQNLWLETFVSGALCWQWPFLWCSLSSSVQVNVSNRKKHRLQTNDLRKLAPNALDHLYPTNRRFLPSVNGTWSRRTLQFILYFFLDYRAQAIASGAPEPSMKN